MEECNGGKVERLVDAIDEDDALFVVNFPEANFDDFGVAGLNRAADELGFDRHFAMTAIDQDAQGDAAGAAEIEEAIHGCANGTPGVEDVVDEDEVHAINSEGDVRGLQDCLRRDFGEVVAVEGDVERADRDIDAINATHGPCDAFCEGHTTAANADERKVAGAATFFDDLMRKTLKGTVNFGSGHQLILFDDSHSRVNASTTAARKRGERSLPKSESHQ